MKLMLLALILLLNACALQPNMAPSTHLVQAEISPGVLVDLPQPAELNETINVSQLITAQWGSDSKQKLLVQLQVDKQEVVLAGFSAWGVKLLSLRYSGLNAGNVIETNVMAGLSQSLPKPERILFNVMLSIWPKEAWGEPLAKIGWTLQENNLQRVLIDNNGSVIVTIDYEKMPYLDGKIMFKHHRLNYNVMIETN